MLPSDVVVVEASLIVVESLVIEASLLGVVVEALLGVTSVSGNVIKCTNSN